MTTSHLLRGGTFFDGSGDPGVRRDVRVRDGLINEIGTNLAPDGERVLDAAGLLVVPGLIDLHAHAYTGLLWSCSPREAGLSRGVTTLLDTGSAGAMTWGTFEKCVLTEAAEDVFALLNISLLGVWQGPLGHEEEIGGELSDARWLRADWAIECIEKYPQRIIGVKARLSSHLADGKTENERLALRRAMEVARRTGGICMAHHAASHLSHAEVLGALRPGDVYTHFYHPSRGEIFRQGGPELEAFLDARARGVILDVGHGAGSFGWRETEIACCERGLWPDTISTDLHRFSINGPVFDLPTTMSKLLYLGMPLPEVIRAATSRPAQVMKVDERFGTLAVGRQADITMLKLEEGAFPLTDVIGETRLAPRRLTAVRVLKRGAMFDCAPHPKT